MIKVEAIMSFTYSNYKNIKNLKSKNKKEKGKIFFGDTFEVDEEEAEYLTGNNKDNIIAVKKIETIQKKTARTKTKKIEE